MTFVTSRKRPLLGRMISSYNGVLIKTCAMNIETRIRRHFLQNWFELVCAMKGLSLSHIFHRPWRGRLAMHIQTPTVYLQSRGQKAYQIHSRGEQSLEIESWTIHRSRSWFSTRSSPNKWGEKFDSECRSSGPISRPDSPFHGLRSTMAPLSSFWKSPVQIVQGWPDIRPR
jgi:hypothetical protein